MILPAEICPNLSPAEEARYTQFCLSKTYRSHVDIYTAFVPFNEATRAMHAMFSAFDGRDVNKVLVLWDRSCYVARLVEAAFPNAEIVVTWEGDHDVLGRKGFAYWTQPREEASAPQVLFCDHTQRMAMLADGAFDLIVGMDILHRVELRPFLAEMDRLLSPTGAAIFPHVHLSNNEPSPFFERGGTYRHGREYQEVLDQTRAPRLRRGFVQSEPKLFRLNESGGEARWTSAPHHDDYNGLVAWLPASMFDASGALHLRAWMPHRSSPAACRGLLNPLLDIDLHRGRIALDPSRHGGYAGRMFHRHPIYERFLSALDGMTLSLETRCLLHHLEQGNTLAEASDLVGLPLDTALSLLEPMLENGGLFLAPLKAEAHRMQRFLGACDFRFSAEERTLPFQLQRRVAHAPDDVFMEVVGDDELVLTAQEVMEAVESLAASFLDGGIGPGTVVASALPPGAELMLVAWSTWRVGAVFADRDGDVHIDDLEAFDKWMEREVAGDLVWPKPSPQLPAVHLFTSGSTGSPKRIVLTQSQLVESAQVLVTSFHLSPDMRMFVHHGLDTMSGLRNAAVLPLLSGGSLVVLSGRHALPKTLTHLVAARPQLITGNPSFYHALSGWAARSSVRLNFVQRPLCTGAPLTEAVRSRWAETGAAPLLNYYGLTETTGCFLAQQPGETGTGVGRPVAGLVDLGTDGRLQVMGALISRSAPVNRGFFDTRDVGEWTPDGAIRLVGRDVRRFKTATEELVLLDDVEAGLLELPPIEDVHAVRRSDGHSEFALAVCVLAHGFKERDLHRAVQQSELPQALIPREFKFVQELPRNLAGKISYQFIHDLLS